MDGGLNTNVIMLTEAEKLPVSLKPLWLQLTTVVKLREIFLCFDHLCGDFFFWLVCFFFLCCIRIILGSQASLKIVLFNVGSNMWNFWVINSPHKCWSVQHLLKSMRKWEWGHGGGECSGGCPEISHGQQRWGCAGHCDLLQVTCRHEPALKLTAGSDFLFPFLCLVWHCFSTAGTSGISSWDEGIFRWLCSCSVWEGCASFIWISKL